MIVNLCPACRRANAVEARQCRGCGARLEEPDTQPLAVRARGSAGAIWLDDLVSPPGTDAPVTGRSAPAEPALSLTLLDIDTRSAVESVSPALKQGQDNEEFVVSDPEPRPAVTFPEIEAPASEGPRKAGSSGKNGKAERRAAVRRTRLRGRKATDPELPLTDVLVCDAHEGERETLRSLLRGFGFHVYAVNRAEEALPLLVSRRFVAAFVDIALDESDGGAGIQLCQKWHELDQRRGVHSLLVLASAELQPMERVRAQMAGCDKILVKPVTRGSLAGALDSHGVALPADPRKG
jgi:CheY-like chemotaxis protein